MTTNASSNDEQVVVERLRASIVGKRGQDELLRARASGKEPNPARVGVSERIKTQGLSSEAAKSEIYMARMSQRDRLEGIA